MARPRNLSGRVLPVAAVLFAACLIAIAMLAVPQPWSLLIVVIAAALAGLMWVVLRSRRFVLGREIGLMRYLGLWVVAVGGFFVTFNGLRVSSHMTVADVLFLAAACLLLMSLVIERESLPSMPPWIPISAAGLLIAGVLATTSSANVGSDLLASGQFAIALFGTPFLLAFATGSAERVLLMSWAWLLSASVNSAIAVLDFAHLTSLGPTIVGVTFAGRPTGLTVQPNHLGVAGAMAIPVGIFLATRAKSQTGRIVSLALTAVVALGILVSGSRAAAVAAVAGVVLMAFLGRRLWKQTILVAMAGVIMMFFVSLTMADQANPISDRFAAIQRLTNGAADTAASDSARLDYYGFALADFSKHPFTGNGFDLVRDAHDIFFQLLQAGGVIALIAFLLFAGSSLALGWRLTRDEALSSDTRNLAAALTASICVWLLTGVVQNLIYDRFLYVPVGLLVGLKLARAAERNRGRDKAAMYRDRAQWVAHQAPQLDPRTVGLAETSSPRLG